MQTQYQQFSFGSKFKWRWIIYFLLFFAWVTWLINIWILNERSYIVYNCLTDIDEHKVALVLGAAVTNEGDLGWYFLQRLEVALELYQAGQVNKILVSGQGGRFAYNEIEPAKNWLLKNGVKAEDIFLDYNSKNTFASMYRAKYIYGVDEALIVSQNFHLPRAIYLARRLDIKALGCKANDDDFKANKDDRRRELLARVKAWMDINFNVSLTLTENPINISSDGRQTWFDN